MPEHKIGTCEEWQAARDELAKLGGGAGGSVEKDYAFDTEGGKKTQPATATGQISKVKRERPPRERTNS